MILKGIQRLFNNALAGDTLPLKEQLPHLDAAIDAINTKLNTCYPVFSELNWADTELDYDCFPDQYIRQVVIPYAAWHYYVNDEEGLQTATQYQQDAQTGLFYMQRDLLYDIPQMYQATSAQGAVDGNPDSWVVGDRGLSFFDGGI